MRATSSPRDYRAQSMRWWDDIAREQERSGQTGRAYFRRLVQVLKFVIPAGSRVLELGCGRGGLLAALEPSIGVGVDLSAGMLAVARREHPHLAFVHADAHQLPVRGTFDVIVLSDLINDLWDVQGVLEQVRPLCHPGTRLVLSYFSNVWAAPRRVAEWIGIAAPLLPQNWLTVEHVQGLVHLAGFETVRRWREILWPFATPLVEPLGNRVLAKLFPLDHLAMTNLLVARPAASRADREDPVVSVVVPARNERGNIQAIFERVPRMGCETELIFVEGGSKDGTYEEIERQIAAHPHRPARLFRQRTTGKADAVQVGFAEARGELLMILDADLTVAPEGLSRFYEAWRSGKGEYVNGVRLVYPMEKGAMQLLNLIANKFFGLSFSWLLGQPINDTLCGTKVLSRTHYELIAKGRAYFGEFDPFGDFDLIFGAAKLNLMMVDLPIRYRARTYGETNISRFRHGLILLRMLLFAMRRIKFV